MNPTFLNTPIATSDARLKVDRANGVIRDVQIVKKGTAKGHNFEIDSDFLDSVVTLANEHKPGIKARFGHPNMCSTALGTYLGRFKNYNRNGDTVLADMYLDDVAKTAPSGNLYDYVLNMAENNPDMFGASIAFKHGEFKETESKSEKEKKNRTATIEYLYATDLVDMPAATDGLFSAFSHDDAASQVTLFLDQHPEIFELAEEHPEVIEDFMTKYKIYKESKTKNQNQMNFEQKIKDLKDWINDNFQAKRPEGLSDENQAIFDQLKADFEEQAEELTTQVSLLESLNTKVEELTEERDTLNGELESKQTDLDALQAKFDEIESELNQLKAKSSNPQKKGDPAINLNKPTAKELVNLKEQMPDEAKLKFQTSKK